MSWSSRLGDRVARQVRVRRVASQEGNASPGAGYAESEGRNFRPCLTAL